MTETQDPVYCALYLRYSSNLQDSNLSIEAQEMACVKYAEAQGWEIYDTYIDRAMSGTKDNRPAFQRMMSEGLQKDHPFQIVLVHKLDRFARSRMDSVKYKYMLRKKGIRIDSVTQPIGADDPTSILLESVLEGMDEFYSANLAREVIKGQKAAAKKGYFHGGRPPYGYRLKKIQADGRQRSVLEIVPEEAPAVRWMFREYAKGLLGFKDLAKEMSKKYRTRSGKNFTVKYVEQALKNEKYVGDSTLGKVCNREKRLFPAMTEPETFRNTHKGIVSRKLWNKVQKVREEKSAARGSGKYKNGHYLLSGILECGMCGYSMVGKSANGHGGKYYYYGCSNRIKNGKKACSCKDIQRDPLEKTIKDNILDRIITEENIKSLIIDIQEAIRQKKGTADERIQETEKQIRSVEQKLNNHYRVIEAGIEAESLQHYAQRVNDLNHELEDLTEKKKRLQVEKDQPVPDPGEDYIQKYVDFLEELFQENVNNKRFIQKLIKKIVITEGKAEIQYQPFIDDGKKRFALTPETLPRKDSNLD